MLQRSSIIKSPDDSAKASQETNSDLVSIDESKRQVQSHHDSFSHDYNINAYPNDYDQFVKVD